VEKESQNWDNEINKISPASEISAKEQFIDILTRRQKRSVLIKATKIMLKPLILQKVFAKKLRKVVRKKRSHTENVDTSDSDSDCSYTIQLCDVKNKSKGCARCYSCYCSPISENFMSSQSVYDKYISRVLDEDEILQSPQEAKKDKVETVKDIPVNYAYDEYLRALAKQRRRNKRSSDDEPSKDCSYNFKKCHKKNRLKGCSDCYNCICRAIPADNKTTTTKPHLVEPLLLASAVKFPQEESDDTRAIDLPGAEHNFEDFKSFLKVVLNNTQQNTIPLISMLSDMYDTRTNNYEYDAKDYYRPFPEKSDGKIRTKNHEYNLSELPSDDSVNINDQAVPTVPPKKRYNLYEKGIQIVHPILNKIGRRSDRMVGQSKSSSIKNVMASNNFDDKSSIKKGNVFEVVAVEPIAKKLQEKAKRFHAKKMGIQ
jgi:protein-arginine kinase activator protein McsA